MDRNFDALEARISNLESVRNRDSISSAEVFLLLCVYYWSLNIKTELSLSMWDVCIIYSLANHLNMGLIIKNN